MQLTSTRFASLSFCLLMVSPLASGATITSFTPAGATVADGAVSASATFVTSAGSLVVTLNDLLASPLSAGQLVSDVDFSLSNGLAGTTVFTSFAEQITIDAGGNITLAPLQPTGWGFGTFGTGFTICVICPVGSVLSTAPTAAPAQEIIGPGPYANANSSIAANTAHNPFLNQSATFMLTNSSITANTTVSNVVFSFGTTPGMNVPGSGGGGGGGGAVIPEPTSAWLLGSGVLLVFLKRFRKTA